VQEENQQAPTGKGGMKGALIGLVAAILLGAGGFYAAYSGMIGQKTGADAQSKAASKATKSEGLGIAFVPLDPLIVSIGGPSANRHLRFAAQLEVDTDYKDEVSLLKPRVMDVLNGYLRAVDPRDIEDPASLARLRAQMLRRIQVVTGKGRVNDLLITEFVLN